jgi:hypothetical protein
MQASAGGVKVRGGFFDQDDKKYRLVSRRSSRVTSWATMFSIHALSLEDRISRCNFGDEIALLF